MSWTGTLIGVSGTNGSGKDSVGLFLAEKHKFLFVSVTDILRDEARRRGLPVERATLSTISAGWRREHGLGVLVDRAIEIYEPQRKKYPGGLVLASLRNPGEPDRIHELGGMVVWVDANPRVRYNRIFSRQRTAEDNKTFDEFLAEEASEMTHTGDEATLALAVIKDKSDAFIQNDGSDLGAFHRLVEDALEPYLH